MRFLEEGMDIILWGAGIIADRVISEKYGKYNILFAVDNKLKGSETKEIRTIKVFSPQKILRSKPHAMVVICVEKWWEVAEELKQTENYKMFYNYIPYTFLDFVAIDSRILNYVNITEMKLSLKKVIDGRRICGLYGLCHMKVYEDYFLKSNEFNEKYIIFEFPHLKTESNQELKLLNSSDLFRLFDLLILGFVYPISGAPDWTKVKNMIRKDCKCVMVSNAAFKGYFPQHTEGIKETFQYICWGDKNINRLIRKGMNCSEIEEILLDEKYYTEETVHRFFERSLKKMQISEASCDIKIADAIEKYSVLGGNRLMFSMTHPTPKIMKILMKRICNCINIDSNYLVSVPDSEIFMLNIHEEFIYPSVAKVLGLEVRDEKCFVGDALVEPITFHEYISLYYEKNKKYLITDNIN